MKHLCLSLLLVFFASWPLCVASAQTPTITSYSVDGCTYTLGVSTNPCSIGPGSKLTVRGINFGAVGGIVSTCDCPQIIVPSGGWGDTEITGYAYSVYTNSGIQVETSGGAWSATSAPYTPIAAQITKIKVGNCTYIPNYTREQCVITPGTTFTIYGNYFGVGPLTSGPQVQMCDCANAAILSWDPDWIDHPSATGNVIVVQAVDAMCGNSIVVWAEDHGALPSNPIPYTTCGDDHVRKACSKELRLGSYRTAISSGDFA